VFVVWRLVVYVIFSWSYQKIQTMYYKFRDFRNYKYILDTFLNQRLYSASFRKLNDNFEGQFFNDLVFSELKRYRLDTKKQEHISICSFSGKYNSHLMWSHYADGHRGFVIGFEIDESNYKVEKVNYNGLAQLSSFPRKFEDIKPIFLNKINDWKYEEEYRIITEKQDYINIKIREIIFGAETSNDDKIIITKLAQLVNKEIKIATFYG